MNSITICPECHQQLELPEQFIGQEVQCGTCACIFEAVAVPVEGPTASQQSWTDDYDYKETYTYTEPERPNRDQES